VADVADHPEGQRTTARPWRSRCGWRLPETAKWPRWAATSCRGPVRLFPRRPDVLAATSAARQRPATGSRRPGGTLQPATPCSGQPGVHRHLHGDPGRRDCDRLRAVPDVVSGRGERAVCRSTTCTYHRGDDPRRGATLKPRRGIIRRIGAMTRPGRAFTIQDQTPGVVTHSRCLGTTSGSPGTATGRARLPDSARRGPPPALERIGRRALAHRAGPLNAQTAGSPANDGVRGRTAGPPQRLQDRDGDPYGRDAASGSRGTR